MLFARTLLDRIISWGLFARSSPPPCRPVRRHVRPRIELLEDRRVLTSVWISGVPSVYETSGQAIFTIACDPSPEPVTVEYRTVAGSANASDYGATSGMLMFDSGTASVTVAIPIVDEAIAEEDESFSVELFNPVNASITIGQASTTIKINDHPPVIETGNQTVDEGQLLQFTVSASDVDVPSETLTYSLASSIPAGSSFDSQMGTFSWVPEEVHGPGVYQVTLRATDNGSPSLSSTKTISITVNEVNEAPTTSGLGDVTVDEDSADTVINLWGAFDDAEDKASGLSYSIVDNSNPELFASVVIGSGELRLDYAANAFGSASITIRATDSGGLSVETTFNVTVQAVNDAPVLSGFTIFATQSGSWIISGSVSDIDDDVEGWSVYFGGVLAGYSISVSVRNDGTFSTEVDLLGLLGGIATAWVYDVHGLRSNIASDLV